MRQVVAVTGANGYVGGLIVQALEPAFHVLRLVRIPKTKNDVAWSFDTGSDRVANILRDNGVTCLFHAAWDMKAASIDEIERICVSGSELLFAGAQQAGVKNIVFISTISAFDGARSAYGKSKLKVEMKCAAIGGINLRLGLVYGDGDGGVFGNLRNIVKKCRFVPMIGSGHAPQYLLHEESLSTVVRRAVIGDFARQEVPVTIANPEPIEFRVLLRQIAGTNTRLTLVPIPWIFLFIGLRFAELMGLKLSFRSDSILSFVFQNKVPSFKEMHDLGIQVKKMDFA